MRVAIAAAALLSPVSTMMVGAEIYPVPPFVTDTAVIAPFDRLTVAVTVAAVPETGVPVIVTVGADVNPVPPFVNETPITEMLGLVPVVITEAEAPVPPPPEKET